MKHQLIGLSQRYAAALQKYLRQGARGNLRPARGLGLRAVALGLETLDLARIHEQALAILKLSHGHGNTLKGVKHGELFFTEALRPIMETHCSARQSKMDLHRLSGTLNRRTVELASANRRLQQGIVRRKRVESALTESGQQYAKLLRDSLQLQEGLRQLTRQVLAAQEDDRKKISLELRDEIAQTLLGINVRLLSLKLEGRSNTRGLKLKIASTERLVAKSAKSIRKVVRGFGNA